MAITIETNNIKDIKNIIANCKKDSLVIFDVDHVLIMPTDEYSLNRYPYRKKLWQEVKEILSKEDI